LIAGIIFAREFLYPLAFGALFCYLLYPFTNFMEKWGIPRILAILISLITAMLLVTVIVYIFYYQLTTLFADFEQLKSQANRNIELLQKNLEDLLGMQDNRIEQFLKGLIENFFDPETEGGFSKVFSATAGTIFRIAVLPVYVFLFLYYRTKFAFFILKIVRKDMKFKTLLILRDISKVATQYMGGVSIVVMILMVLNSLGLIIIGVEYHILLGIISAIFNFIPYFGTLIGGAVPLLFVLLTTTDPMFYTLRVLLLFAIIQFTENNILTPNIVGSNVNINPFFIIIGLVFGGTIWGIPGMLLIVPFLAIARIIFSHLDQWKPYSFLLGPNGTEQHSISLQNIRIHFKKKKKSSPEKNK
jgi:predicted PurR-regulated permease PerM